MLSKFFAALALVVLPPASFYGGWALTEAYFGRKLVPLPFETFGVAVGAGFSLWTLSFLLLVWPDSKKKENSP